MARQKQVAGIPYRIHSVTGKRRQVEFGLNKGHGMPENLKVKFKKITNRPGWVQRTVKRGNNSVNKKNIHLMNVNGLVSNIPRVSENTKRKIINEVHHMS